jgi:hypothetical protein
VAGSFEHGNESSGSIKGRRFPDQLRDYQLLKKGNASAPWSYNDELCVQYMNCLLQCRVAQR